VPRVVGQHVEHALVHWCRERFVGCTRQQHDLVLTPLVVRALLRHLEVDALQELENL
jgi:hypothetical protein